MSIEFATRPGFGQQGFKFDIRTNFFRVRIRGDENGKLRLHHYRVDISRDMRHTTKDEAVKLKG